MDNLEFLKFNGGDEKKEGKSLLEFEISDQVPEDSGPTFTLDENGKKQPKVKVELVSSFKEETVEHPKEEFSIPDTLQLGIEIENSDSFMQTPAAIRPTYIPRFTEVSETYRMQDDPRPRPKTDTQSVKVEKKSEVSSELDPTSEKVEEKEIEKIVLTSAPIRNSESADETLTVLKFSTPVIEEYENENDESAAEEPVEVISEPVEISEPETEENTEAEPLQEPQDEIPAEPKNLTIPDPDTNVRVIDFTADEISKMEEPFGASDSDKKDKNASNSEFTAPIQRDSIKDRFLDTLMSIKVRLAGALVLLIVMIMMDGLNYFGVNVFASVGLGNLSSARAIVDMQFSICIFLFTLPEFVGAFKLLIKGKIAPELINLFALVVIVLNDLAIAANSAENYLTFGVLYGLQCIATIVASYSRADSDFVSFKLVSRNVAKNVLDKRFTRELPRENLALDGVVDEYNSKTARMFRTVFVSNFFKRSSVSCENFVNTATIMAIGAGIALVTGLVSFFLDGYSVVSGAQSLAMVFMFSYPVFSILSHKLPLNHVSKRAAFEESAFVGESSVLECADVDVFTYEDTEIFGIEDVSLRKVHLYGKAYNTPKAMKQMYSLFSVVGGPLDFVFSAALDRKCPPAQDIVIEDNGVSGVMDGHKICAGTEEYMISHGITIPDDDYRTNTTSSDSTKVMYGAEDGEVYVKFFIRYSFSEEFTMLLPDLKEKKIIPLVYTRDPNITADLLKVLTLGEDIIRVMKKYVPRTSEEKTYRRIDSGIVTHGNKDNAINMVLLAKKYAIFQNSLSAMEMISMVVGAVLAVVLAIGDMFILPATLLSLWQIVWCAVLYVRSKLTFQIPKDREEYAAEQ